MKRHLSVLLALILLLTAAGCAGSASSPAPTAPPEATASPTPTPAPTPEPTPEARTGDELSPLPDAEALRGGFYRAVCSFHHGVAGSSLGQAMACCAVLRFAGEAQLQSADDPDRREALIGALREAWAGLSDDERSLYDENFEGLAWELDECLSDWESRRDLFDSVDSVAEMEAMLADPAYAAAWAVLRDSAVTARQSAN